MKLRPSFAEIVVRLRRMSNLLSGIPGDHALSSDDDATRSLRSALARDSSSSSSSSTNLNLTEIAIRIDDMGLQEDMQEVEQLEREGQAVDDEDDQRARLLDEYDQTV